MTERKVIQGDAVFETFRRKLADAVLIAINSGIKIGKQYREYCPIGCATDISQPTGAQARLKIDWIKNTPLMSPSVFMDGFDGNSSYYAHYYNVLPYYELGKLYREMFIERK